MASDEPSDSVEQKIETLHRKLLFSTIAIDYLSESVDNGMQKRRFVAQCRQYFRTGVEDSMEDVVEILMHFERKGQIAIGKYDVLKNIVRFNIKIIEEIRKTEMAMKKIGANVITEKDNGCDEFLVAEVANCNVDNKEWQTASKILKEIQVDLQNHSIRLVTSNSQFLTLFAKNYQIYMDLTKESTNVLRLIQADENDKRIQSFVELAGKGKELLLSNDAVSFHKLADDWKTVNHLLLNSCTLIQLLEEKGATTHGILISSLFIFLRFESLQMLDSFWKEYNCGLLNEEMENAVSRDVKSDNGNPTCRLTLSEENYNRYRLYLESQIDKRTGTLLDEDESCTLEEQTFLTEAEKMQVAKLNDQGSSLPPQTFIECGECGGNDSVPWFCKNCPISLCDKCKIDHKSKRRSKYHTVVPRSYHILRLFGPAKIAEQCKIHPEKDISTYCNKCNIPCCVSCLAKDHQGHDFDIIENKYLNAETDLNEYRRKLGTEVRPALDKMEELERADAQQDDINSEKVINSINNFRDDIVSNFSEACDNIISQVHFRSKRNIERLEEIEKSKENALYLEQEIDRKIETGELDIMKYVPPKVEKLIPKPKCFSDILSCFEPTRDVLESIKKLVEKVQLKEINYEEKDGDQETRGKQLQKVIGFESSIRVSSITKAISGRKAWVMYFSRPTIYLYNDNGKEVTSVAVEGTQGINDLAISRSGEIIVSCTDCKVRFVSLNQQVSIRIYTSPFECFGVCLTEKEDIVVCMGGQGEENHVAVYSHDGSTRLREIRALNNGGKKIITDPRFVVTNGQYLCVLEKDKVVCVDKEGYVRWTYNGMQATMASKFNPRGICVDHHHNLLITDTSNHCVHHIDGEGGLIQVILRKEQTGLNFPWAICVDNSTGHVWLGSRFFQNVVIANVGFET